MDASCRKRYRVLMVTGIYPTEELLHSGTFIKSQADSLRAAGLEVEVIHPKPGPMPIRYISAAMQVFFKTLTRRYDIVHGHFGLWCLAARLQWTTPVVASFLGDDLFGKILADGSWRKRDELVKPISRWLCSVVDAVIVKSEGMKMAASAPEDKIFVIPNGVDFELFHPISRAEARTRLGWDQDRLYVLFGNDPQRPVKNFPLAQAAIESLLERGVSAELVVANGLSQKHVVLYLNASNALILPSLYEGSPNIAKEAMACNIPVVATDVGDVSLVIGHTKGCAVCPDTPKALALALEEALLMSEPTTGRADIRHLENPQVAQQVIAVYTHALKRKNRNSPLKSNEQIREQEILEAVERKHITMSSIHIGTICFDWYPFEPRVLRLVQAAAGAHYSVDVICLRQPHEKRFEIEDDVRIYRMPMKERFGHSLPLTILSWCWFLLLAAVTVTRLHLKHPYDVIHVHNMPDFLVFSTVIPKLLGAKIILDVQDVSPELMGAKANGRLRKLVIRLATWQERISTAFADHVVTVGWPFEARLLERGVPREKLTIIINSADPKLFPASRQCPSPADSSVKGQPFIVMYHGTMAYRNGMDTAIRALAMARAVVPNVRLDIQGRDEHLELLSSLTQLATELGVNEHVVFSRSCPPHKLVDFVTHGDVGIIPYRCDGFMELVLPTKAYEWAWMHRPIIASDTSAIRSMFRPESIILCDPQSAESFAKAIIDLYQHAEKRAQMVTSAFEDYSLFEWERMAKRYQQLLVLLSHKQQQPDPIGYTEAEVKSEEAVVTLQVR